MFQEQFPSLWTAGGGLSHRDESIDNAQLEQEETSISTIWGLCGQLKLKNLLRSKSRV